MLYIINEKNQLQLFFQFLKKILKKRQKDKTQRKINKEQKTIEKKKRDRKTKLKSYSIKYYSISSIDILPSKFKV